MNESILLKKLNIYFLHNIRRCVWFLSNWATHPLPSIQKAHISDTYKMCAPKFQLTSSIWKGNLGQANQTKTKIASKIELSRVCEEFSSIEKLNPPPPHRKPYFGLLLNQWTQFQPLSWIRRRVKGRYERINLKNKENSHWPLFGSCEEIQWG